MWKRFNLMPKDWDGIDRGKWKFPGLGGMWFIPDPEYMWQPYDSERALREGLKSYGYEIIGDKVVKIKDENRDRHQSEDNQTEG